MLTSLVGLGSRELCPYRITAYETAVKAEKKVEVCAVQMLENVYICSDKGADNAPDVKL